MTDGKRRISFEHAPTLWNFFTSQAFVGIVRGPVGSGKSTGCAARIMAQAMMQEPGPDGYRYAKWGIVRNTYGELTSTTLATWRSIFPENQFGPVRYAAPIRHHIRFPPHAGEAGLDLQVEFIALDRPKDVRRLLSWEGSGIWFNECREIEKAVFDAGTARVGRYPSMAQGGAACTYPQIIADTNPPDEDHWLYGLELERPDDFAFFVQPPAVLEIGTDEAKGIEVEPGAHIDAAGKQFIVNPNAENLPNLPDGYYRRMLAGKSYDWIRIYAQGKYGYVNDGKAITPEYDDHAMTMDNLQVMAEQPLWFGADIGGGTLQPAGIIAQRHPQGTWLIHAEVVCTDMGLDRFSDMVLQTLSETFPNREIDQAWGDPAGATRDEIFETVAFQHLRKKGIPIVPAQSNSPKARVEAWRRPMQRLINGKPGLLVHRRCKTLRAGLSGRWFYRRLQVAGTERYSDTAEKNHYSHPCDAGGYLLMGGGEYRAMQGRGKTGSQKPIVANTSFDIF